MPNSPVEAEATGQEVIEATFSGTTFTVPLDVDSWPLEIIRRCRTLTPSGVAVDSAELVTALKQILGPQWPDFLQAAPRRGQLVAASHVFAAAVGIPGEMPSDVVFGSIPRLLALIETWPTKVESDLDRFWDIDYRDRWRFLAGRRQLTLRTIYTRLTNLPTDSSLAIAMNGGKFHRTATELVLMDVYEAITHRRHPSRPMPIEDAKARDAEKAAVDKARADYAERQAKREAQQGLAAALANKKISERGKARAQNQTD